MKPKKRSKLRIAAGRLFYTWKRYFRWYSSSAKYANKKKLELYPEVASQHNSPLLRKLKDVDMWLQYNKITNLKIAAERINGTIIEPGEVFSYWRLIGKPTRRKGYVDGMVLHYGGFGPGVGGGLCQLSNLLYWMTLHTPLTVIERHRHSYDVFPDSNRTQPFGSGATCVYNYIDIQIKNETNQPYQLNIFFSESHLYGEWRTTNKADLTYEVYEKEHWITHELWGGYVRHNLIYRKVFDGEGVQINDEYVTENHAIMMYQPFLSNGDNCS